MRICRYLRKNELELGFYFDDLVVPLSDAIEAYERETDNELNLPDASALALLPHGEHAKDAQQLATWLAESDQVRKQLSIKTAALDLQNPCPIPEKFLLLAGNYALHIAESGEIAEERKDTFPYVFMKPRTALNHPMQHRHPGKTRFLRYEWTPRGSEKARGLEPSLIIAAHL